MQGQRRRFPPGGKLDKYDINNDILYDTRLRLNMNAKVWDNVKFSGRLAMYKSWGDSTGSTGLRFLESLHHGRHQRRQHHR